MTQMPKMDSYQTAIQNPRVVFEDADLQSAQVYTDHFGLPKASSGGFALTFKLFNPNNKDEAWAVRCFHREVVSRQQHYDAISQFLKNNRQPIFTTTEYLPTGILVNGTRYPIIKMPWISGQTLNSFIDRNIASNPAVIVALADPFLKLASTLEHLGVAHGDLQHGNIMVINNNQLMLIDYDDMYLPALAGSVSASRGNENYQHPNRNAEFNAQIDRFSTIVIYLALKSITPDLWNKYSKGGENILFKQDDFRTPRNSLLLAELETRSDLKLFIQHFRTICESPLDQVPSLADFLSGNMGMSTAVPIKLAPRRSQYPLLDASHRGELLEHVGEVVTVIGKVLGHSLQRTVNDTQYVFMDFGNWRQHDFRLVVWSDTLELFKTHQRSTGSYNQEWVSVTGLMVKYTGKFGTFPQIVLENMSQTEILSGEEEAKKRLAEYAVTQSAADLESENAARQQATAREGQSEREVHASTASGQELQASKLYSSLTFNSNRVSPNIATTPKTKGTPVALARPECVVALTGAANFRTISEAIQQSPTGTLIRVRPGVYHETLRLNKKVEIVGDGRRDDIVVETSADAVIRMVSPEASIRGLTLRLRVDSPERRCHAVDIPIGQLNLEDCDITSDSVWACVGIHNKVAYPTIRNCRIHDCNSAALYFYTLSNGLVENCDIFGNALSNIWITTGSNPTIRRCQIHEGKQGGIYILETGMGQIEDCDIFENATANVIVTTEGNPTVNGCKIYNGEQNGIHVYDDGQGLFENCDIFANSDSGIAIRTNGNPTLTNCEIHDGQQVGILIQENGQGQFEDCDIFGNALAGIHLKSGAHPVVRGCKVRDGKQVGVYAHDDALGLFEYCEIFANADSGMSICASANPTVINCKIHDGLQEGVYVHDKGLGQFTDCNISANTLANIIITTEGNPTVDGCKIHSGQASGIYVYDDGQGQFTDCEIYANALAGVGIETGGNPAVHRCQIHDGLDVGIDVSAYGLGRFKNCDVLVNAQTGVTIRTGGKPAVIECRISENGDEGVWVFDKGNGLIEHCDIQHNKRGAFTIDPGCGVVRRGNNI